MSHPSIVLGAGSAFGSPEAPGTAFNTREKAQAAIDLFRKFGHKEIDTARRYPSAAPGTSEEIIGQTNIKTWGLVDTKVLSNPNEHKPELLAESVRESLKALGVNKLHILYLHFPDRETPLEDVLKGMDILHKQGMFEKLGVSNYSIDEVKKMMEICMREGFVKPSVYQGQYSAIVRRAEEQLIPILRSYNISYYAFSPAAGGIFSKTSSRMASEHSIGDYYRAIYGDPVMTAALNKARDAAEAAGINGHALALRWCLHHSKLSTEHGDAMIIGASGLDQLERTLKICDAGPLPQDLVDIMEEVWNDVRPIAPSYSSWVKMEGVPDHTAVVNSYISADQNKGKA